MSKSDLLTNFLCLVISFFAMAFVHLKFSWPILPQMAVQALVYFILLVIVFTIKGKNPNPQL